MKEIQRDTKYWLIRPGVGAKCFEAFYKDNCIAIGWDKIGNINTASCKNKNYQYNRYENFFHFFTFPG